MRRLVWLAAASAAIVSLGVLQARAPVASQVRFTEPANAPEQPFSLYDAGPAADHDVPAAPPATPADTAAAEAEWVRAYPVGNGQLGAMIFGGVEFERLQLNEATLWAGRPYDPVNPAARAALPDVRRLIADARYADAAKLVTDKVLSLPLRQMPYQTLGNLRLAFPHVAEVKEYRRDLNLDTAVARVSYTTGGVKMTREVFASAVDHVVVVRLTADRPGQITFRATFDTPQRASARVESGRDLVVTGVNGDGIGTTADGRPMTGALRFQTRVRALNTGGALKTDASSLSVSGATSVTLLISAATSYKRFDDVSGNPEAETARLIAAAARKTYALLRAVHVHDYQQLYHRVVIDLGHGSHNTGTARRIAEFGNGQDPSLAALYFQYARYLLISSSRPGGQPATLQGLWNASMNPPWGSKYTININTEMNYWPANVTALDETLDPLMAMVTDLAETGARTARTMYGASGWVTHHNTDLWRATGPIDGAPYGMWPTGGAWLAVQLWDRYRYTRDRAYLTRLYPVLRGSAAFFLDTLVEEPTHHWLVTSPSLSPENAHPFGASIAAGPAMDEEILRDLFDATRQASEILGLDADLRARWTSTRDRLAPLQIGAAGQLQEWLEDWDMQARDLHHRHVSHLYALFPSHQIDPRETPALAAAARKSLEIRGDQATGWATAWRINLWARLGDGEHAYSILKFLLSPERTYPNMFDAHPPFQIDGNFGGARAIVEMLMQSRDHGPGQSPRVEVDFLPALPSAWPAGGIAGLRAYGGLHVDLAWKDGRLLNAKVESPSAQRVRLRTHEIVRDVDLRAAQPFVWDGRAADGAAAVGPDINAPCPVSPVVEDVMPDGTGAPRGYWFKSPDNAIWVTAPRPGTRATGIGPYWRLPEGVLLHYVAVRPNLPGRPIVGDIGVRLNDGTFSTGSVSVDGDGCWQVTARAATTEFTFTTDVRYSLDALAERQTARVRWSQGMGVLSEGAHKLGVTALVVTDATTRTREMSGVHIELTNGLRATDFYIDADRLAEMRTALARGSAGTTPTIYALGGGYTAAGDTRGLQIRRGNITAIAFETHTLPEFARLLLKASDALAAAPREAGVAW